MTSVGIPWKRLLIVLESLFMSFSISGVRRSQTADYQGWVDLPTAFCTMNFSIFQFSSIVKVDANTARSDWGDCVYECGSTIHLPYIRWPVNSLVMLRPPLFFNLQEGFTFLSLAGNLLWQMGPEQSGWGLVKQDSPRWLGSHHRLGKELYHTHLTRHLYHHHHKYHQVDQLARISLDCPCSSSLWSRLWRSFCEFSTSGYLRLKYHQDWSSNYDLQSFETKSTVPFESFEISIFKLLFWLLKQF